MNKHQHVLAIATNVIGHYCDYSEARKGYQRVKYYNTVVNAKVIAKLRRRLKAAGLTEVEVKVVNGAKWWGNIASIVLQVPHSYRT